MNRYPMAALGDFLTPDSNFIEVDPDTSYKTVGMYNRGRGLFARPTISGSETTYRRFNRLHEGQVIYSKLFGWEGALGFVTKPFHGFYASQEFPTFSVDEALANTDYVRHLLAWPQLHAALSTQGSGMGSRRQRVNPDRFLSARVPLPDLSEQCRIASKLNTAIDCVAMVESLRKRVDDLYLQFRDELIREAGSPHGHGVLIGDVLQLERVAIDVEPDSTYNQIGIRSFGKGIFHREPCPGSELAKLRYFMIQPNRLIISNIMAWEGAIATSGQAEEGCVGSSRFLSFLPIQPVDLRYLHHFFQTSLGIELVRGASTGTVTRNQTLSIDAFERLRVPLPDFSKQTAIAGMLDSLADRIRAAHSANTLESLKAALLYSAFNGRL